VGKQTGGDIIAGKKTFLVLEALALSHGTEREEFSELISDRTMEATSKVEKVIAIYRKLGVPEATLKAADNYVNRAMEALNSISAPDHRKQVILEYLNTIARRQH
jgi:geranylgeranyl diphosphate synthase type II